jgi:hypothetical protein
MAASKPTSFYRDNEGRGAIRALFVFGQTQRASDECKVLQQLTPAIATRIH